LATWMASTLPAKDARACLVALLETRKGLRDGKR
jgi:hypothetical protein